MNIFYLHNRFFGGDRFWMWDKMDGHPYFSNMVLFVILNVLQFHTALAALICDMWILYMVSPFADINKGGDSLAYQVQKMSLI